VFAGQNDLHRRAALNPFGAERIELWHGLGHEPRQPGHQQGTRKKAFVHAVLKDEPSMISQRLEPPVAGKHRATRGQPITYGEKLHAQPNKAVTGSAWTSSRGWFR